jgi:hypothetical protein
MVPEPEGVVLRFAGEGGAGEEKRMAADGVVGERVPLRGEIDAVDCQVAEEFARPERGKKIGADRRSRIENVPFAVSDFDLLGAIRLIFLNPFSSLRDLLSEIFARANCSSSESDHAPGYV